MICLVFFKHRKTIGKIRRGAVRELVGFFKSEMTVA